MTDEQDWDEPALPAAQADAAAAYHAAPDGIPRDAMWSAIAARRAREQTSSIAGHEPRAESAADADVQPIAVTVTPTTRGALARLPRWLGAVVGAAAVITVFAITRDTTPSASSSGTSAIASAASASVARTDTSSASTAWRVASAEHFGLAESMLTTLGTSPDAQGDRQLTAWSRDLLESTRLLMDSPAGRDPKRRALLQELELVLVQLVESGPAMRTDDRSVMDEMLSRSALLLTRIRTTVPAGVPASRN